MDSKSEVACTYAALILADDGIEITADKLNTILKAANCKFVEGYVTNLFASALSGRDIKDILSATSTVSVASAPSAAAAPVAAPTGGAAASPNAPAAKEEEKKKEESEESDGDMGFDLFG